MVAAGVGLLVGVPVGCSVRVGVEVNPKAFVGVGEVTTGVLGLVGLK